MYKKLYLFLAVSLCLICSAFGTDTINVGADPSPIAENPSDQKNLSSDIEIVNAWARPASYNSNSAIYFTIKNNSNTQQNLIGASRLGLAQNIELHGTFIDKDGKAVMKNINKILIPAKTEILLKPGNMHVMVIGLKRDLVNGETFKLNLAFEGETSLREIEVTVKNDSN